MSLRSVSQTFVRNLKPVNCASLTPCIRTYATEKKTVHPPRRIYLHDQYTDIIENNRAVFIFQHNNLTVKEFTGIRQQLGELGSTKLTVLRTGVFSSALRQTKYANLEPLITGPTCVLSTDGADNTELLKKSVELLGKNKKLLLLGGKLDDVLLTQADVLKVVDLPSIDQLRAQLVGVIEAPARKLLGTLEQPAKELHSVLDRRI
ncbi:uncharacterized protein B0P05DRAFT_541822 [Gilbertella persicaria]|uniref:YmL10 n=1 Tax=Rhizopus stolonifer TaxID=4846 RepID=A0A367KTK1_RHIST|nr:uncharacterized protein B0P05DRAFT_541822 [Gilbertella persicaria]KAI8078954.1 hypothetical protein B0P05DRAFT_541822 [Gilbertella persicaria]RCI05450.1 YmL10 [Rhizopus stolonifer]